MTESNQDGELINCVDSVMSSHAALVAEEHPSPEAEGARIRPIIDRIIGMRAVSILGLKAKARLQVAYTSDELADAIMGDILALTA